MYSYTTYDSQIGLIHLIANEETLVRICLDEEEFKSETNIYKAVLNEEHSVLKQTIIQLDEYFQGIRKTFELPININGTKFQEDVWNVLATIPYGETTSYQDVAKAISNQKAVRAVGQANKANKLPIIIPCHRVIGKNQKLTGYLGKKTNIKEFLLHLEGVSF